MTKEKDYYQPYLEWESIDFPLMVTRIKFEKELYNLAPECIVEVWRGVDFKLQATIEGTINNKDDIEINESKLDGTFLPHEQIIGQSVDGLHTIILGGVYIKSCNMIPISIDPVEIRFKAELSLDSVVRKLNQDIQSAILFEWYLSSKLSAWFPRRTERSLERSSQKIREEIDSPEENNSRKTQGSSRDFTLINSGGLKCIVALVPHEFKPLWAGKVCIEYRTSFGAIPSGKTRKSIAEFISFILGCQLLRIGDTELSEKRGLLKQFAMNYWGDNIMAKCAKRAAPPVNIDCPSHDWQRLEVLFNALLPTFLSQNEPLNLSAGLWKYWVATDLAVGSNLPVYSSAVEGLASIYLKNHSEISLTYMDVVEFQQLIEKEILEIDAKLEGKVFREIIINKLRNAAYRGSNEKMNLFFDSIGLPVGKVELEAMKARNIMAHGSISTTDEKKLKQYAKLTQAYQTLFNRVMLRLLDYKGDYIDYYSHEVNRPIAAVVGEEEVK